MIITTKKKNDKLKEFKKQINRTKNFSVQLVSKLDYYREEEKSEEESKEESRKEKEKEYEGESKEENRYKNRGIQ